MKAATHSTHDFLLTVGHCTHRLLRSVGRATMPVSLPVLCVSDYIHSVRARFPRLGSVIRTRKARDLWPRSVRHTGRGRTGPRHYAKHQGSAVFLEANGDQE